MTIEFFIAGGVCILFLLLALLFAALGEKGAMLVSGFNTMPKDKREQYDKARISKDQRNLFFFWSGLWAVGTISVWLVSGKMIYVMVAIQVVLFFREVHLDEEKAFGKYRKREGL